MRQCPTEMSRRRDKDRAGDRDRAVQPDPPTGHSGIGAAPQMDADRECAEPSGAAGTCGDAIIQPIRLGR